MNVQKITLSLFLLLLISGTVFAKGVPTTKRDIAVSYSNEDVEQYRAMLLKTVETLMKTNEQSMQIISATPYLEQTVKDEALLLMGEIQDTLTDYETQIITATTMEELIAINKDMIAYVQNEQETLLYIASLVTFATNNLALDMLQTEIMVQYAQLEVLQFQCRDYKDEINELQGTLLELKDASELLQEKLLAHGPVTQEDKGTVKEYIESQGIPTEDEIEALILALQEQKAAFDETVATAQEVYDACVA